MKEICIKQEEFLSDIEIFLNSVQGVTIPMLQNEVRRAISLAEYTDHDYIYIYKEEGLRLTIIQERLVIPIQIREEIKNGKIIDEEKTFKENECMVCLDKEPNVLFCNCGHLCVCEECRTLMSDKNKCPSCKADNKTIRIL